MRYGACLWLLIAISGCKKKSNEAPPPPPDDAAAVTDAPAAADAAPAIDATEPDASHRLGNVMPDDWFTTGCPKVLARIGACATDPAFTAALTKDADKKDKKEILSRAKAAARFAPPDQARSMCSELPSVTFEDQGFLDGDWSALAAADVLADCAKLGAAINEAGGLWGGPADS